MLLSLPSSGCRHLGRLVFRLRCNCVGRQIEVFHHVDRSLGYPIGVVKVMRHFADLLPVQATV